MADPLEASFNYSRRLTGSRRTAAGDRQLGFTLAFVAGATNAGGFLAVQQYTSHMTGIVSAMADNVALGLPELVLGGVGALFSFVVGAGCSAVMVNYARRHRLESEFAFPLLLEAFLLCGFGVLGARLARIEGLFVPVTVMLLCFIMGLQNAVITKLSHAVIRTTHVTGVVTDIGIELGKLLYWNRMPGAAGGDVAGDRSRLMILCTLVSFFFTGGVIGALGFKYLGYVSTVPLALVLVLLAAMPAVDDVSVWVRKRVGASR